MLLDPMDSALAELVPIQEWILGARPVANESDLDKASADTMGTGIITILQYDNTNRVITVVSDISMIACAPTSREVARDIKCEIQQLANQVPWLMKALDEVMRIHPVVSVAVLPFKAVYALEKMRKENDLCVLILYVEMKEMMKVMVQLKELAEKTAKDIQACANFCDTFVHKNSLSKVLKGPVWAKKLTDFIKTFSDRKVEFEFELAIYTTNVVTEIKHSVADVQKLVERHSHETQVKIDAVVMIFCDSVSTEERQIINEIDVKSRLRKVEQDDEALKDKLLEDVSEALEKNLDRFMDRFKSQVDVLYIAQIEHMIQQFTDDLPWLMKALDEVAQIHPVVSGVEHRTNIWLNDWLEKLAEKMAKDIKDCANLCDMFIKKKLLARVFKSPVWAEKFAGFVEVFENCKAEFKFALMMQTANHDPDIKQPPSEIQAKLDTVLGLFNKFVSADEHRLSIEIDTKGGLKEIEKDDEVLKVLIDLDKSSRPQAEDAPGGILPEKAAWNNISALEELKAELRKDIEYALKKNLDTFTRKFELQYHFLKVAQQDIRVENDRVIGVVMSVIDHEKVLHMKIKNEELRKIWQDMAKRPDLIANNDWALEYLSLNWVHLLMEAFDDDASGYMTIMEVNKLMDMHPLSLPWSIPHWLAYWAVGWRVASTSYIVRIKTAIGKMQETLPWILPYNCCNVDWFFFHNWYKMFATIAGFETWNDWTLEGRFQDYIKYEEDRIGGNLEKIKYNIDTPDTVTLVVRSSRLEKALGIFREKEVDRIEQFKAFACRFEQFLQVFQPASDIWSTSKLDHWMIDFAHIQINEEAITLDGIEEAKKPSGMSPAMFEKVNAETEDDREVSDPIKSIVGEWNGFTYLDSSHPNRPMLSLHLHYSKEDGEDLFSGHGADYNQLTYTLSGKFLLSEDSQMQVKWDMSYGNGKAVYYHGTLIDEFTITGMWVYRDNANSDSFFILKKIPMLYMTLCPPPSLLVASKYHYLWHYAISATLQDVQQRLLGEVSRWCTAAEAQLCESTSDHFYLMFPYHWSTMCERFSKLAMHNIEGRSSTHLFYRGFGGMQLMHSSWFALMGHSLTRLWKTLAGQLKDPIFADHNSHFYVCDECEGQMLITCWSCHRRFPQPEWYYRFKPTDFTCPTCCRQRIKSPDPDNPENMVPDPQVKFET
ncbi:hypothetical protein V8D89_004212 [Ganoderma adspersum]